MPLSRKNQKAGERAIGTLMRRAVVACGFVAGAVVLGTSSANAAVYSWATDTAGNWSDSAKWTPGGGPPVAGDTATLGNSITQNRTVTVDVASAAAAIVVNTNAVTDGVYTIAGASTLTLDAGASITTGGSAGNGGVTISAPVSLSGGTLSANVNSYGNNLSFTGVISSSATTAISKNGFGTLSLRTATNTFTGDITINSGFVDFDNDARLGNANNDIYLNGGNLTVANFAWSPAATRVIDVSANGGALNITGNTTVLGSAGQLTGSGRLSKQGTGTLTVNAANAGLSSPVYIFGGLVDTSASASNQALGTGTAMITNTAQLTLPNATSVAARTYDVRAGGIIQGDNTALASLTRGGNLTAAAGSVIVETAAGGNAGVGGLGSTNDLYFGVGATIATETVTVGGGSAWRGLAASRNGGTIQDGTITVNGNFDLLAPGGNLTLGNGATSNVDFTGTASVATVRAIRGPQATGFEGYVRMAGDNPTLSGISSFVIKTGGNMWVTGVNGIDGKAVSVEKGASFGEWNNNTGNSAANAFGTSDITLKGANRVNLRANSNVALGGDFIIEGSEIIEFNANQGGTGAGAVRFDIGSLTFNSNNSGIILVSSNSKTMGVTGAVAGGANNFTINSNYTNAGAGWAGAWTGSGTFTKGDANTFTLTGDLSGYSGNIVVRSGTLDMLPSTATNIFGGTGGTSLYKPVATTSPEDQYRGYGTLVVNRDQDWNSRIDSTATGILGLGTTNNSTLTGVNGSAVFIAPQTAGRTLSTTTLAAGSGNTYRLGGGGQTLTMDAAATTTGVLTGANNLIVGGPRRTTDGTNAWFAGTVALNDTNNYTGTTTIGFGSNLTLNSANAIGNGASLGDIDVTGTLSVGGTTGTGTIGAAVPTNIVVRRGGLLSIDDGAAIVADRVPNGTAISLNGNGNTNNLAYLGRSAAGTSAETLGATTLNSGFNVVTVNRQNASNTTTLTLTSLTRNAGTQLNVNTPSGTLGGGANNPNLAVTGMAAGFVGGWAYANNTDFATYSGTSFAALGGVRPTLAAATAGSDPVSVGVDTLGAPMTVNSYRISGAATVGLGGNALTITSGGLMHTGGTAVTISAGSITSGGTELIINGTNANTTISANLTGTNGITVRHSGTLILSGANSFSGNSYLNGGTTQLNTALTGNPNIDINPGATLSLRSDSSMAFLTGGTITIKGPTVAAATINVNNLTANSNNELSIFNLTAEADTRLTVNNSNGYRLVTTGAVSLGAGAVVSNAAPIVIRGTYSDTATTVIRDTSNTFISRYSHGLIFDGGNANTVNAIIGLDGSNNRASFQADGANTVVTFQGYLYGGNATSHIGAYDGGKVIIGASATLDNSFGWSGTSYATSNEINFDTRNGGVIEFAAGFQAKKVVGTLDRSDVNFGGHMRINANFITNHSQNISDTQQFLSFELTDSTWTTNTNSQTVAAPVFLRSANANFVNNTALNITAPVFIGTNAFNDPAGITRDWQVNGFLNLPQSAMQLTSSQLTKTGAATLTLSGPVVTSAASNINVTGSKVDITGALWTTGQNAMEVNTTSTGTLAFNNTSVNGAGWLDVTVKSGATLQGGNATATAGFIPGILTVESGGILTPGNSTGILSVVGEFGAADLLAGSIFETELDGTAVGSGYDQLDVTGTVSLAGDLSVLLGFTPALSDLFFIIKNDGIDAVSGTFSSITFDVMGATYLISYVGDFATNSITGGNDVVLYNISTSEIPEPASLSMLALGAAGLLMRRRK